MTKPHDIIINRDTWARVEYPDGHSDPDKIVLTGWSWYRDEFHNSSVRTPGFRKLKRYQLPVNPYYQSTQLVRYSYMSPVYEDFDASTGMTRTYYRGPGTAFYADLYGGSDKYPEDDPSNLAIQKLQSSVSLSAGNMAVTMAEAHKTAAHLAHTATRIATGFSALKKGRFGDFAKALGMTTKVHEVRAFRNRWRRETAQGSDMRQFAASAWLEYSYGWKPLLSDLYAQADNFARVLTERQYVVREARASAHTEKVYTEAVNDANPIWKNRKRVVVKSRVIYIVRYRIPNGANNVANVFGLLNPASVAWELVPFSFVVDWFLPIGNFLEGLTAYNGLEFAGGSRTGQREVHVTCTSYPGKGTSSGGNFQRAVFGDTDSVAEYHELSRTVLSSFPAQRLPQFKDPRSFAHAASAISLLQSVFLGSQNGAVRHR